MMNVTNSLRPIAFAFLSVISISLAAQTNPLDKQSPGTRTPTPQMAPMPGDDEQDRQDRLDRQEQKREDQRKATPLIPLPPEPDIEFQDFVAASLGYRLPIFGQDLFQNVPSTFAPLDRVPVT